jgi:hypothetical protein
MAGSRGENTLISGNVVQSSINKTSPRLRLLACFCPEIKSVFTMKEIAFFINKYCIIMIIITYTVCILSYYIPAYCILILDKILLCCTEICAGKYHLDLSFAFSATCTPREFLVDVHYQSDSLLYKLQL